MAQYTIKQFTLTTLASAMALTLSLAPGISSAARFQAFSGITYSNPAALMLTVPGTQMIVGNDYVDPNVSFNGYTRVPNPEPIAPKVAGPGQSTSNATFNMPYGRLAQRFNDQLVVSLDFSEPFDGTVSYPPNSSARYAGTFFDVGSQDLAPNVAYQFGGLLKNLMIGGGLDAMAFSLTVNGKYPSLAPLPFGAHADYTLDNSAAGRGYGWHTGIMYHLFRPTFVGLTYFSQVKLRLNGSSIAGGYPPAVKAGTVSTSSSLTGPIVLPPTAIFNLVQAFSQTWYTELNYYYTKWSRMTNTQFANVAGPSTTYTTGFTYPNTWRLSLRNHFEWNPKINLGQLVAYDHTPTSAQARTPLVPSSNCFTVGVNMDYKLTKAVMISADYSHLFFRDNAPIGHTGPTGIVANGEANVGANVYGLKLTVNI